MWKVNLIVGIILVLVITAVYAENNTPEFLYQKALYLETAKADYEGAIKIYEEIVKKNEKNAEFVARALYRMGVCWEKLGETKKAQECALQLKNNFQVIMNNNKEIKEFANRYSEYTVDWELIKKWMGRRGIDQVDINSLSSEEQMEMMRSSTELLKLHHLWEEKKLTEDDYKKYVYFVFTGFFQQGNVPLTQEQEQKFRKAIDTYLDTTLQKKCIEFKDGFDEECKKFLSTEQISVMSNPPAATNLNEAFKE